MLSKGQDRAQKGIRHHTEWSVFLTSRLTALKTLVVPVSTDRAQSPWKGEKGLREEDVLY